MAGEQALLEQLRQELAHEHLLDFIRYTFPGYLANWFHESVCAELETFLAGVHAQQSPRLILEAPPRHGKTEMVSRRFPAWALGADPDLSIIAASYASELASRNNRDIQRIMDDPSYHTLYPKVRLWASNVRTLAHGTWMRNSDIFEIVGSKGVYRSAGVMGGITGMGANILLIDDPVKDAVEADSQVFRDRLWEWFTTTAYTRLAPGGGVAIIMTRWHEDDLVGRLLQRMKDGDGDQYRVVRYPAVAEADEPYRKEGEPLHAERYGMDQLNRIKTAVGQRSWAALYQQRPAAAGGMVFKRDAWAWYKPLDTFTREGAGVTRVIQSWDTAHKKGQQNDYSACITGGVATNRYPILDLWKQKVEYPELKRAAVALADKWNPDVVLIEDTSAGQALIQELRRETRLPLVPVRPEGDKMARANAVTPVHEAGLVALPEGAPWVSDFMDSCGVFPNGMHDDDVDAFTQFLGYAARGGGGMGLWEFMRAEAEEAQRARRGAVAS